MAHTITLSDEHYLRLRAAAQIQHRTPEQIVGDLVGGLPEPERPVSCEEYDRRWAAFMQLAGSIQHGQPLTAEEMDELIGEEAAETHSLPCGGA